MIHQRISSLLGLMRVSLNDGAYSRDMGIHHFLQIVLFAPVGKPKAPGKPVEEAEGLEIFVASGRNQLGIEILADPNERNGVVCEIRLSGGKGSVWIRYFAGPMRPEPDAVAGKLGWS